jgi:ABC-type uncharacterized transport system involved in gliding motility auxiliary subunit
LSLEIENAIAKAGSIQKDLQLKNSNEILDLYRTISTMQRKVLIAAQLPLSEATEKLEKELSYLIQRYNDKAQSDFLFDSLELPEKCRMKPSALSKIKSALGLHKFLQRNDSKDWSTIKSYQSSMEEMTRLAVLMQEWIWIVLSGGKGTTGEQSRSYQKR